MSVKILQGDCRDVLATLAADSIDCCVTSPPYWNLRSYLPAGHPDKHREIGSEPTVEAWVQTMVDVFREVRRVLRDDGTLWVNLGDSYANDGKWGGATGGKQAYLGEENSKRVGREKRITGLKPKDLIGQPWRVAFALQADGWWLRQELIYAKKPFKGAHYATYPPELIRPFVLAGCPPGGVVLDPFGGSGTTGLVADQEGRSAILIDLDARNIPMATERITAESPLFAEVLA